MHDRVVGVLPALIVEPHRRAPRVGQIVILRTGAEHPSESALQVRPELPDEGAVSRPPEVLGEEHREERGGVHRAVVRDEGNLAAGCHLTAPELLTTPAGLLVW